jgi:general secretion pathway protein G
MKSLKTQMILLRSSAFTLMEIMIVIGIIMLLAGLAIPFAVKSLGKGQMAAAKLQIQGFETAITNLQIDTGKIPRSLDELLKNNGNKKWDGPYLNKKEIPQDPWGNKYVYEVSGSSVSGYKITCYGSDGAPGGSKMAADITNY